MGHKDNADLRSTGEGGWCYTEHELFSVFLPLIKADGGMVYMALCRLIPLAAVDERKPVTIDRIVDESTVSRSTTQRKLREIVALGMVEEKRHANRRPSTYKLVPLRQLAKVGQAELLRRIGVPQGDTEVLDAQDEELTGRKARAARSRSGGLLSFAGTVGPAATEATAPEGAGESGVPLGDTGAAEAEVRGFGDSVSQKMGLVSQKEGSVSQKTGLVSQGGHPFNEEDKEGLRDEEPPTPVPGDGGLELILPFDDPRPGGEGWVESVGVAARWVMLRCGISKSRTEKVISEALTVRVRQQRAGGLREAAEFAVQSYTRYTAAMSEGRMRFGPWGPGSFFGHGYWQNEAAWPWKDEGGRASGGDASGLEARVGMRENFPAGKAAEAFSLERVKAFVLANADQLEERGAPAEIVARLRELVAGELPQLDDLDRTITEIEDALAEHLRTTEHDETLVQVRNDAHAQVERVRGNMTREQFDRVVRRTTDQRLRAVAGYPKLSLFHMPQE